MASVFCPVCGTENPATRQFCRKCASDLRAPVADPTAPVAPPPLEVPVRPIVLGGAIALAAVIVVVGLLLVLGGSPAVSPSPSPILTPTAATASPAPSVSAAPVPSAMPTAAPTQAAGPTEVPPPSIVSFEGPATVDCASFSGTIHLTWRAANAEGTTLAIDGPGLYKSYPGVLGQDDVPFGCGGERHTYTLTTVGGNGPPVSKTLVIAPR
jgi:hypothetical protein